MMDDDAVTRALNDARALLDTLLASGWQDMHAVSGRTEIFIARTGGRANPLRRQAVVAEVPVTVDGPQTAIATEHVSTLVDVLSVGTPVVAGQKVATVRVLEEEMALLSPVVGRVAASPVQPGTLVEFGTTILSIAEAA
ncbi:hypothetical protein [Sphingobium sp.]|uniref:hypothetical protein n=1 Tax=Sphingobium sp. TaxID=1912891 RepID=UPI0028BF40ED|nr:hypothetical protein [Sphingobium sp.]